MSYYDTLRKKDIVVTNEVGSRWATDYDEKVITYIEGGACGKLYSYNIRTEKHLLISEQVCGPARISKHIIIWGYAVSNGSNVYGYDLRTHNQFDIATEEGFNGAADIDGNKVIWINNTGSTHAIKTKNLNTGEIKTLLETSNYSLSWPSISRRYAVWGKNTAQHISGVEGIDLRSGIIFEIQEQGSHQNDNISPIVNDDIAAWMAWRTGNGDIYGAVIDH